MNTSSIQPGYFQTDALNLNQDIQTQINQYFVLSNLVSAFWGSQDTNLVSPTAGAPKGKRISTTPVASVSSVSDSMAPQNAIQAEADAMGLLALWDRVKGTAQEAQVAQFIKVRLAALLKTNLLPQTFATAATNFISTGAVSKTDWASVTTAIANDLSTEEAREALQGLDEESQFLVLTMMIDLGQNNGGLFAGLIDSMMTVFVAGMPGTGDVIYAAFMRIFLEKTFGKDGANAIIASLVTITDKSPEGLKDFFKNLSDPSLTANLSAEERAAYCSYASNIWDIIISLPVAIVKNQHKE